MFTEIDDLTRPLYSYLQKSDQCWALRLYTAYRGYAHSETNSLISNLKKTPDKRSLGEWTYKERAMDQFASEIRESIQVDRLHGVTLVPMPPSKSKTDPMCDDRMAQILHRIAPAKNLDIRELLLLTSSMTAAHTTASRPTVADLIKRFEIESQSIHPHPRSIAIFDDVLTTGAHFVAAKTVLQQRFPDIPIRGFFLARRIFPDQAESG